MSKESLTEIMENNKKILRAEYQRGYIAGSEKTRKDTIAELLKDLWYNGEAYIMSNKDHKKWI